MRYVRIQTNDGKFYYTFSIKFFDDSMIFTTREKDVFVLKCSHVFIIDSIEVV